MSTLQNAPVNEQTFTQFLFHNRRNRITLHLAAAAIVIQFAIFKYLYPFANYIHGDSFRYLNGADQTFIAILAFGLSKLSLQKTSRPGISSTTLRLFVGLSMFQYKKLSGYWQFSPFSGWQLANNAIYIYREVDSANREPVPAKFKALDNKIRFFFASNPELQIGEASTAYMWTPHFPLWQYCDSLSKTRNTFEPRLKRWAGTGPLYHSYGLYIIKTYPIHFLRYFVWPNFRRYFAPPLEYLGNYNWGYATVPESAVKWFGYKNNHVKTRMKNGNVLILRPSPFLAGIFNLIIFLMLLSYILLKGWQYNTAFYKTIFLAGVTWIANAVFSISVASVVLRLQAFPALLTTIFSLLLIDWMVKLTQHMKLQNQQLLSSSKFREATGEANRTTGVV